MAQAKMQLADAELAKAKQAVVLKVMTLNASIKELKAEVALAENMLGVTEKKFQTAIIGFDSVLQIRSKLEQAQNALARAEMELKLMTGASSKEATLRRYYVELSGTMPTPGDLRKLDTDQSASAAAELNKLVEADLQRKAALEALSRQAKMVGQLEIELAKMAPFAPKGPMAERIRAALDKPVKLGPVGERVTFEKALEAFKKQAGWEVPVRINYPIQPIVSAGEELPIGAWFQLFADEDQNGTKPRGPGPQYLVREYGILVTNKEAAPPDAISLGELWKQPLKKEAANQGHDNALPKPKESASPAKK